MNVSLTPQLEKVVKRKLDSGFYTSASEVIREALRLLDEQDRINTMRLAELKKSIQQGIDSGSSTPLDMEKIKAKARRRRFKKN